MMREIIIDPDFSVDDLTAKISNIMSKWSIHFLDINGPNWIIFDYDMNIKYVFIFNVDFNTVKLYNYKVNKIYGQVEGICQV
jgi:hypothetical protein